MSEGDDGMELVILAALLALVDLVGLGCFLLAFAVAVKLLLHREADTAAPTEEVRENVQKPDPMDEGFENIMNFAVGGKTGSESDEG